MRLYIVGAALSLSVAACGAAPTPEPTPTSSPAPSRGDAVAVNPARIDRVRYDLPPGYEVVALEPRANPVSLWGFGPQWAADPAECATPAAPDTEAARGWSASGPGGIVYAAVAKRSGIPGEPVPAPCDRWSVSGGHSTGTVTAAAAPQIAGATTVGMSTAVTTVVEGGTETRSHADTFTADLAGYHVFVTVITDPGSPTPALDSAFTSDLLVKTVSALRG